LRKKIILLKTMSTHPGKWTGSWREPGGREGAIVTAGTDTNMVRSIGGEKEQIVTKILTIRKLSGRGKTWR